MTVWYTIDQARTVTSPRPRRGIPMRGPRPFLITLTSAERADLEALVRRHTAPQQLVLRARVVLAAADGLNNAQIARHLERSVAFVRRWRERWIGLGAVSLVDLA